MQLRWTVVALAMGCGTVHDPSGTSCQSQSSDAGSSVDAGTASKWTIVTTPASLFSDGNLSVMVDASGVPHIAYGVFENSDLHLWHTWVDNGQVQTEQVDGPGRGWRTSWVRGSLGPRLVYDLADYGAGGAFHALRSPTGAWAVETLSVTEPSAGMSASWQDDRLHIARLTSILEGQETNDPLERHGVTYDGLKMPESSTRVAAERVPPHLAVARDASGGVHIVYTAPPDNYRQYFPDGKSIIPHTVRYVTLIGEEWSEPVLLREYPGLFDGLSIAIDERSNVVHVTFSELISYAPGGARSLPFDVHHLSKAAGSDWEGELVPIPGPAILSRGSMSLDADGALSLAYCAVGEELPRCAGVGYARWQAGTWIRESIQEGCDRLGSRATLDVGTDGTVFVAYRSCDGGVSLASRASPGLR